MILVIDWFNLFADMLIVKIWHSSWQNQRDEPESRQLTQIHHDFFSACWIENQGTPSDIHGELWSELWTPVLPALSNMQSMGGVSCSVSSQWVAAGPPVQHCSTFEKWHLGLKMPRYAKMCQGLSHCLCLKQDTVGRPAPMFHQTRFKVEAGACRNDVICHIISSPLASTGLLSGNMM